MFTKWHDQIGIYLVCLLFLKQRETGFGVHFMLPHLGADLGKHRRASSSQEQYFGCRSLFSGIIRVEGIGGLLKGTYSDS